MSKNNQESQLEEVFNEVEELAAVLYFKEKPNIDMAAIKSSMLKIFKKVGFPDEERKKHWLFTLEDYLTELEGNLVATQMMMMEAAEEAIDMDALESAFLQSWHWDEAATTLTACSSQLDINDLHTEEMDPDDRVVCFQQFLLAIIQALSPAAIYFPSSDKLMEPTAFVAELKEDGFDSLTGFLNVRLFNIEDTDGEVLMDTIGMQVFGLPDFQISFKEQDPDEIAALLISYAYYIYENGAVIQNGNTIQGLTKKDQWTCHYSEAATDPDRIVIMVEI